MICDKFDILHPQYDVSLFGSLCLQNNNALGTIEISQVVKCIRFKKSKFSQSHTFLRLQVGTFCSSLETLNAIQDGVKLPLLDLSILGIMQRTNPTVTGNNNHGISGGKIHCIPMHISTRKHINHFMVGQQQTTRRNLITIPPTPCSLI